MSEQLRKLIVELSEELEYLDSRAKLLRVIEMLVEQRNKWIKSSDFSILNQDKLDDAELIAALEGVKNE